MIADEATILSLALGIFFSICSIHRDIPISLLPSSSIVIWKVIGRDPHWGGYLKHQMARRWRGSVVACRFIMPFQKDPEAQILTGYSRAYHAYGVHVTALCCWFSFGKNHYFYDSPSDKHVFEKTLGSSDRMHYGTLWLLSRRYITCDQDTNLAFIVGNYQGQKLKGKAHFADWEKRMPSSSVWILSILYNVTVKCFRMPFWVGPNLKGRGRWM